MDIQNLIASAVDRYQLKREHLIVAEWDRESPINDTPAAAILAAAPEGRTVLLRVGPLDIVIYRQNVDPKSGQALTCDRDVERVKAWMLAELIPRLMANETQLRNAVEAALAKRMYSGLVAEARAEQAALGEMSSATEDPFR